MTCEELIAILQKLPPKMKAVVDLHSEYTEVKSVVVLTAFENGGYISRAYRPEDVARSCGYVYFSNDENPVEYPPTTFKPTSMRKVE
jgi:hypothetical protein